MSKVEIPLTKTSRTMSIIKKTAVTSVVAAVVGVIVVKLANKVEDEADKA